MVPFPPSAATSAGKAGFSIYRKPDANPLKPIKFPELAWDASLHGVAVLADFTQTQVAGKYWWQHIVLNPPGNPVPDELDDLQRLAEYRPEVMAEAVAQMTDMVGYWAGLLMFSPYSHPWTFRVARIAIVVGEFVSMHYKRKFNRPRPSQLSPLLMPPMAVPGHSSAPSGHATQAYLLSGLLSQAVVPVMPEAVTTKLDPTGIAVADTLLDRLAERVARNREVMGLHYRSDSECGRDLAAQTLDILLVTPMCVAALKEAQKEWVEQ
ncbi:MAG: hypothetical protein U1E70_07180 [Acetobacteraceae bacterium]